MNRAILPAILVFVILVAGVFAFAPIEKATTLDSNVIDEMEKLADALCDEMSLGSFPEFDPDSNSCISGGES